MNLQGLNGFSICSKMAAVLKCKKNKMKWCSATTRMQTITHPKIQQVPRITGICFMQSRQQAAVYAAFFLALCEALRGGLPRFRKWSSCVQIVLLLGRLTTLTFNGPEVKSALMLEQGPRFYWNEAHATVRLTFRIARPRSNTLMNATCDIHNIARYDVTLRIWYVTFFSVFSACKFGTQQLWTLLRAQRHKTQTTQKLLNAKSFQPQSSCWHKTWLLCRDEQTISCQTFYQRKKYRHIRGGVGGGGGTL